MKTISGKVISTKPISFSKAAKIFKEFVNAENGASPVIKAYLERTKESFEELNKLHKELKSPRSDRKHKRNRSETHDTEKIKENSVRSVEIDQEQNQGAAQSKNNFRKHLFGGANTGEDEEKPSQVVVKSSQEPNDAVEYHAGNEGGSERHKKKKKKSDVENWEQRDKGIEIREREGERKLLTEAVNDNEEKSTVSAFDSSLEPIEKKHKKKKKHEDESKKQGVNKIEFEEESNEGKISMKAQEGPGQSVESYRELDDSGDDKGMEEGIKHKREKKKKKDKDDMNNFSGNKAEVVQDESAMRTDDLNERDKIPSNGLGVVNGGLVDARNHKVKRKRETTQKVRTK